jgi:hypothetical protein
MSELADRLGALEAEVEQLEGQIEAIRQGDLAETVAEIARIQRKVALAERQAKALLEQTTLAVRARYQRKYRQAQREHRDVLARLKSWLDRELARLDATQQSQRSRVYRVYRDNKDEENDRWRAEKRDLKFRYERDLDAAKDRIAPDVQRLQNEARDGKAALDTPTRRRGELFRRIANLQTQISKRKVEIRKLRVQVARRPKEAWALGLRPRNGRYVIDPATGELSVIGGLWGRPANTRAWQVSNASQVSQLLALAEKMIAEVRPGPARKCLQRLLAEFPTAEKADLARTLLDGLK